MKGTAMTTSETEYRFMDEETTAQEDAADYFEEIRQAEDDVDGMERMVRHENVRLY